jgi:hypothetical protein
VGVDVRVRIGGSDGSVVAHDERNFGEVHANVAQERHLLFHLRRVVIDLARGDEAWFADEPLTWRLDRQDDNGARFEIAVYSSRCEATAAAHELERRGHKQTYWVEEIRS